MHDLKCFSPMFSQEKLLMLHTHHDIKCQATPVLTRNTPVCQKHKTRSTCVDTLTRQHWDRAPAFQARPLHLPSAPHHKDGFGQTEHLYMIYGSTLPPLLKDFNVEI